MKRKSLSVATVAAVILVPPALLLRSCSAAPLPAPTPYAGPLPSATPPRGMAVIGVVTGVGGHRMVPAYRGGSLFERRDFSIAATLVRHPAGDLLIDTGLGRHIDEQFRTMPLPFRAWTFYSVWRPAVDQLMAAGYDPKSLRAILLTHSHWDHESGLPDFAGVPVWVSPQERHFIEQGGIGQFTQLFSGIRYEAYGFEGGPYLGFPCSHDIYGDGSIVVVPAPGHTPGSVIIFVTLPNGMRYAFVGDLVWQLEGITLREERPWISRKVVDSDANGVRDNMLRMIAITKRLPGLIVVPAHDMRAFADMPTLSQGSNQTVSER